MSYKSQFKAITGADKRIQAERKFEQAFQFKPTVKLLFSANKVPSPSNENDDAFYERWIIIKFDNFIPRENRDEDLDEKLTTDEELSGVLNWALEGLDRLLDQGGFNYERTALEKHEIWEEHGNSIDRFISECLVEGNDGDRISSGKMYDKYVKFCEGNDSLDVEAQNTLTSKIKEKGVGQYKKSIRINGKITRGFKNLRVNLDIEDDEEQSSKESLNKFLSTESLLDKINEVEESVLELTDGNFSQGVEIEKVVNEVGWDEDKLRNVMSNPVEEGSCVFTDNKIFIHDKHEGLDD